MSTNANLPERTRDEDLDAIGDALGESFYLSSQGMSEWPTLDECKRAGRRAAREVDHRITDWQYRSKDEWTRALRHVLPPGPPAEVLDEIKRRSSAVGESVRKDLRDRGMGQSSGTTDCPEGQAEK
jgi:hypothetical protein